MDKSYIQNIIEQFKDVGFTPEQLALVENALNEGKEDFLEEIFVDMTVEQIKEVIDKN